MASKLPIGSGKGRSRQFSLNKFFDLRAPSMRKVNNGKRKKEKKEKMSFLVATNVIASRPPECRPTGTPHARAKIEWICKLSTYFILNIFFNTNPEAQI